MVLAYFSWQYAISAFSFVLGFIACFTILMAGFVLNTSSHPSTPTQGGQSKLRKRTRAFWVILLGVTGSYLLYQVEAMRQEEKAHMMRLFDAEIEQREAERISAMVPLMSRLLEQVHEEVKSDSADTLSPELTARIVALSHSLQPHASLGIDSNTTPDQWLSPERGQFLLALLNMPVDPISLEKIKQRCSFAGADLNKADLSGFNLSGIDLRRANLREARLRETDLSNANLRGADCTNSSWQKANLRKIDLRSANLNWAKLTEAKMHGADLRGAKLVGAQFRKSDCLAIRLRWSDLSGALLCDANLKRADFLGAVLEKTNFDRADLTLSDLRQLTMNEASMVETTLEKARVEEAWMAKIQQWNVVGKGEILSEYEVTAREKGGFELTKK